MSDKTISDSPIWDDIKTLDGSELEGQIDIIYGGFPCQDISIAGHGKGLEGERSGLVHEILRLSRELRPSFIFLENVPAITARGGLALVKEITTMGYDCRWCVISASSVGAKHKRDRWFLLANSMRERCEEGRQSGLQEKRQSTFASDVEYEEWDEEPENKLELAGMVDGLPDRTHRVRALGNAVVPQQVKKAFKILMGIK